MLTDFLNTHKIGGQNNYRSLDHIMPRDSQTGLHYEEYFNELLALKKKRYEQFKNHMFLMLVDLSAVSDVSDRQEVGRSIMEELSDVTRDTDVKGWHAHGLVMGIVFAEMASEESTSPFEQKLIANRCLGRLRSHLGVERFSRIQISGFASDKRVKSQTGLKAVRC
jgi:hypothetical protein